MFAGIIGQYLPAELTPEDMEAWRHDPEGLAAVLAGLKVPPKRREGIGMAPVHVGAPPRTTNRLSEAEQRQMSYDPREYP